ncbi:MAG: hypothetical protein KAV87_27360 [Desulfobacteraceae bacterium]|nr:hypothetical protein [Desulfobacteraceae bacterium]
MGKVRTMMAECAMCDAVITHTAIIHHWQRVFHWGCFKQFVTWLYESGKQLPNSYEKELVSIQDQCVWDAKESQEAERQFLASIRYKLKRKD